MLANVFNFILSLLASLIQIVVWPINQIIINLLPDFSDKLAFIGENLTTLFTGVTWGLGVIPPVVLTTLLFILSVEIARYSIYISTHVISLVFLIIRRIKFW